jgi:peptide/nickel transport system ATP-binding protein
LQRGRDLPASKVGAGGTAIAYESSTLLEVSELKVHFPVRRGILQRTVGHVRAVDGISFAVARGRTLALVGESGCGKTTAGKALLRLIVPTDGEVRLRGELVESIRPQDMQMVFQDPFASLDPRLPVGEIIAEGMRAMGHQDDPGAAIAELLEQVGLQAGMAARYPHEFSGGQRQRIAIARALAVRPKLLICDEPTSALDVSVQAQILNLLADLQRELGLAYLFITHNIAVVDYLADDLAVMYLGRIVEQGPAERILNQPRHPYTQALLAAVPRIDGGREASARPVGDMPSPMNPPLGCHFHPRCPQAGDDCRSQSPVLIDLADGRRVACHRVSDT